MTDVTEDTDSHTTGRTDDVDAHVARLARALAVLVRLQVDASVRGHAARVREVRTELRQVLLGCLVLALGASSLTAAAVLALDTAVRPWASALIVGGGSLMLALVLVLPAGRRVARSLAGAGAEPEWPGELTRAEADARESAEALVEVLVERLAAHEERRLVHAAEREVGEVGHELAHEVDVLEASAEDVEAQAASALEELVEIVTLPGRAGIDALRRLAR